MDMKSLIQLFLILSSVFVLLACAQNAGNDVPVDHHVSKFTTKQKKAENIANAAETAEDPDAVPDESYDKDIDTVHNTSHEEVNGYEEPAYLNDGRYPGDKPRSI